MIERELLNSLYDELSELIGEEAMLKLFANYRGLYFTFPKRLYDGKKVAIKLQKMGKINQEEKRFLSRKYNYSQRQIERFLHG